MKCWPGLGCRFARGRGQSGKTDTCLLTSPLHRNCAVDRWPKPHRQMARSDRPQASIRPNKQVREAVKSFHRVSMLTKVLLTQQMQHYYCVVCHLATKRHGVQTTAFKSRDGCLANGKALEIALPPQTSATRLISKQGPGTSLSARDTQCTVSMPAGQY